MEISLFRCSWNRRVAVTASSASMFLRMTLDDITTIVKIDAMSSRPTAMDARISTRVKARRGELRRREAGRKSVIGRTGTR
jgi:hypothetical protein